MPLHTDPITGEITIVRDKPGSRDLSQSAGTKPEAGDPHFDEAAVRESQLRARRRSPRPNSYRRTVI